jgi:hypothetical protein
MEMNKLLRSGLVGYNKIAIKFWMTPFILTNNLKFTQSNNNEATIHLTISHFSGPTGNTGVGAEMFVI